MRVVCVALRGPCRTGNYLGLSNVVETNYAAWIYPVMGRAPLDPVALAKSK